MAESRAARAFRRHLIAGLIVIAPAGITAYVLWWIFRVLDGLLGSFLYSAIGMSIPGLGLFALVFVVVAIGWLAERTIGARAVEWWHGSLERIPLARRIYSASNRIVRTVLGQERSFFHDVVLCEYPSEGRWSLGFLTAPAPRMADDHVQDGVTVFIPTTPNPTSGFLTILARDKVVPVAMTVEEAFTYILSAGAVTPDQPHPVPVPTAREQA
jgi:uncharacterized membrane protein